MKASVFYSHGKLLLTGEYAVLDGAEALALPCKLGQYLKVRKLSRPNFQWTSYLKNGKVWQKLNFELKDVLENDYENDFEKRLFQVLKSLYHLKPELFNDTYDFSTHLEFEKNWGLGSSSTLINNLAQWAKVDPYLLLDKTFGGSGYDIAAAQVKTPFIYKREKDGVTTTPVEISKNITPHLYFVYLNQKQNSRDAIQTYRQNLKQNQTKTFEDISKLTHKISQTTDLEDFEKLLKIHEQIISKLINQPPVQEAKFKDYDSGIVKSLGAWGGDFVLVTCKNKSDLDYFKSKSYNIIFSYRDLIY